MGDNTKPRDLIVVDVETNGLDVTRHIAVEVAWWNLTNGKRGAFIPPHNVSETLALADIRALQINRYVDRIATGLQDYQGVDASELLDQLAGNTLVAVNPGAVDGPFLKAMFRMYETKKLLEVYDWWHYRMWDINAYAAGVLGLDELPGLAKLCELVGIEETPDHTAAGDVTAAGNCFIHLQTRARANAFHRATSQVAPSHG